MTSQLLIVDKAVFPEPFLRELASDGFESDVAPDGPSALSRLEENDYGLVLADVRMPSMTGREFCERALAIRPGTPLVMMSESEELAAEAIQCGATDCLVKPITPRTVARRLRSVVRESAERTELVKLRSLLDETDSIGGMLGQSEAMLRILAAVSRVAASDVPVLIAGPRGAGKKRAAQAIHNESRRKAGPFLVVPCANLPDSLLEKELLGASSEGMFEAARGGTLCLADVDALSPEIQSRLARRIAGRAESHRAVAAGARIIAATRRASSSLAAEGIIQPDLLDCIGAVTLELPPLRERDSDVLVLARRFIDEYAVRSGRPTRGLDPNAARRILDYDWPGNVRELRSAIERGVAVATTEWIQEVDLPDSLSRSRASHVVVPEGTPDPFPTLDEIERSYIARVLARVDGNKSAAARVLGFDRRTLYRKLERYQRGEKQVSGEDESPNIG